MKIREVEGQLIVDADTSDEEAELRTMAQKGERITLVTVASLRGEAKPSCSLEQRVTDLEAVVNSIDRRIIGSMPVG